MNDFVTELKNTPSLAKFLAANPKQIYENDYIELRNKCVAEAFGDYVPTSMGNAYGYFSPRHKAFKEVLDECNIHIRWNSEFEDRLKVYLEQQGPAPGTPFAKLDWYSQKRKELEDIMAREDNDVGC
jgi:hypothetical protein